MSNFPILPIQLITNIFFHKPNHNVSITEIGEIEEGRQTMQKVSQLFRVACFHCKWIQVSLKNMHGKCTQNQTCIHLINTVQEVIWGSGYTVAAHAKSTVCAFISGVICSTATEEKEEQKMRVEHSRK